MTTKGTFAATFAKTIANAGAFIGYVCYWGIQEDVNFKVDYLNIDQVSLTSQV